MAVAWQPIDVDTLDAGLEEDGPPASDPSVLTLVDLVRLIDERRPEWQTDALCREYPAEWWFPGRGDTVTAVKARRVCERCASQDECNDYALRLGAHAQGIWAGRGYRGRRLNRPVSSAGRPGP